MEELGIGAGNGLYPKNRAYSDKFCCKITSNTYGLQILSPMRG